jgi:hypothetical protein
VVPNLMHRLPPKRRSNDRTNSKPFKASKKSVLLHGLLLVFGAICLIPLTSIAAANRTAAEETALVESGSSTDSSKEYRVKAAFLFNFCRYTTWPKDSFKKKDAPLDLIVIGKNPFGNLLDKALEGKFADDHPFQVQYVSSLNKDLEPHLVFVADLKDEDRDAIIKWYRGKKTLVIGDQKGFAELGSCANFLIEAKGIRFEVNTEEVKKSGLEISSRLLQHAFIVKTKEAKK